jgi:prophage regulatory protein
MNQTLKQSTDVLFRRKEVERIVSLSSASIYRLIKIGKFPRPVALGTGSVRWKQSDLVAWQSSLLKTKGNLKISIVSGLLDAGHVR